MATRIKKISILFVSILAAAVLLAAVIVKNVAFANSIIASQKGYIGEDRAKEIALEDAKVSASDAKYLRAHFDRDDYRDNYDVEFYYNGREYDYEIDAKSGAILEKSSEREYIPGEVLNAPATPDTQGNTDAQAQTQDNADAQAPAQGGTNAQSGNQTSGGTYYYDEDYYDDDWDDWDDRYDDWDDRYDDWDDRYDDDWDDDWDDRWDD